MSEPLVQFDQVCFTRGNCPPLFTGLNWTIRDGETWAIVGPTGGGKTTLAELLRGQHLLSGGTIRWPLLDRLRAVGRRADYPSQVITHVRFKEESRLFSYAGHYYQQRFEFADSDNPLSLDDFLRTETSATPAEILATAEQLGVREQLKQPFLTLSNGQTRRARLARALLTKPELLILDDPFVGVDAAGRAELTDLLGRLIREGMRLVLICRADLVPNWVTHTLELPWRMVEEQPTHVGRSPLSGEEPSHVDRSPLVVGEPVVELRDVSVVHAHRTILNRINWTVRAGERWAVMGPNGSGKTTLLSLLCGDHPQAYANEIRLFGRRRGSGETIWDVKRNVGLVSPEFHFYFTQPLTAARAAATGFFDALADGPTTAAQETRVRDLFAAFGISHLFTRPFRCLSTGEQRLVLLVRALVKRPPLLILDEPFQSLDSDRMRRCRDWLDHELGADQTLVFVTHDWSELPRSVTKTLRLEHGHVVQAAL
jgi:molybdate transport system ATP-binding protein